MPEMTAHSVSCPEEHNEDACGRPRKLVEREEKRDGFGGKCHCAYRSRLDLMYLQKNLGLLYLQTNSDLIYL